ncbi:LL-diaminopimelate aminotransferase [bacterium]|nr:LL-diaminopimelate aminotransferase [bacterium]
MIDVSKKLKALVEYPFAELDRKKAEVLKKGGDVISLGIGDPDLGPFPSVIEKLKESTSTLNVNKYPSYKGSEELRYAVAKWYKDRFGVKLDHETEVLILIGAKEGIGHIPLAFVDQGDSVLVPDPGYPVYKAGTILAGGSPLTMPLHAENGFLPDLKDIEKKYGPQLINCKMMFLNYPNNPTSAIADEGFFKEVVDFAQRHNIIICHDATYSEITYDNYKAQSFLETEGAKNVGVEFHSLSKSCNMTGWRIGFVVGNREVIVGLGKVKTNMDSGAPNHMQIAGIEAINTMQENLGRILPVYKERRDLLVKAMQEAGINMQSPKATFYLWIPVPAGMKSVDFCGKVLEECGVLVTPGTGFGAEGEGYFRISLTASTEKIEEAYKRIKNLKL